jgi:hypothetical protein
MYPPTIFAISEGMVGSSSRIARTVAATFIYKMHSIHYEQVAQCIISKEERTKI